MISFEIIRYPDEETTSSDQGDLVFNFDNNVISTNTGKYFGGMIYIAICDLIYELMKNNKNYEFVFADNGKFILNFQSNNKGDVNVFYKREKVGSYPKAEILSAIYKGIGNFLSIKENNLPKEDVMHEYFYDKIKDLDSFLAKGR